MIKDQDIVLFNKIANGNELAFNALFDIYYVELCDFSHLIVKNRESAEEIVADLFANIWIKRGNYFVNDNLRGYLMRSTKNRTISYMRKNKMEVLSLDDVSNTYNYADSEQTPENVLIRKESDAYIEKVLSSIPEKSRLVFKMHRFESFKFREIAEILDISQKTVEKHMGKALKILRGMQHKFQIFLILSAVSSLFHF
ncbi:MAG: RNA polymerase sigma-70 factor [Bacteroidales bacterium]|nr:RNA polymerase sigma-70 factor [Bacteroidales bacterium]